MANTTKNTETSDKPVMVSKVVTEEDVKKLYNEGKNIYQIVRAVYGFESEEGTRRIQEILGLLPEQSVQNILED